jgi:hypothetical protein
MRRAGFIFLISLHPLSVLVCVFVRACPVRFTPLDATLICEKRYFTLFSALLLYHGYFIRKLSNWGVFLCGYLIGINPYLKFSVSSVVKKFVKIRACPVRCPLDYLIGVNSWLIPSCLRVFVATCSQTHVQQQRLAHL